MIKMTSTAFAALALAALATPAAAQQAAGDVSGRNPVADLTSGRIARAPDAEPGNWTTYYGGYDGQRYSRLDRINTRNVGRLGVAWSKELPGAPWALEAAPLVIDGVMYVTTGGQTQVYALDAKTGREIWKHETTVSDSLALCCGWINRGVAVAEGKVLFVTLDATLHALDASNGRELWSRQFAEPEQGYSSTLAPLVVKDKVMVGTSGGEYGIRGHIDALNLSDGALAWRFYTVPGPGQPGHETWEAPETWRTGGGSAWITGTYDPALDLVYWGIGNPGPDLNGAVRPGDNLYTNSIVALDPDDGSVRWHFQATPHDVWDYDASYEPILADIPFGGRTIPAVMQVSKNGILNVLDRTNGRFIFATPVGRATWLTGINPRTGRPIIDPQAIPGPDYVTVCPSFDGIKSWNHMSYSPQTRAVYIPINENCTEFRSSQAFYIPKMPFVGGDANKNAFGPAEAHGFLKAVDAGDGHTLWEIRTENPVLVSTLATAGGLVFWGETSGKTHATDARTGRTLWTHDTKIGMRSNPVTYLVDGEQYVAYGLGISGPPVTADFAKVPKGHKLVVFKLK